MRKMPKRSRRTADRRVICEMAYRLALVELELQTKDKNAHVDIIDALAREAARRSFGLIAEKVKTLEASAHASS